MEKVKIGKKLFIILVDIILINFSFLLSIYLRFLVEVPSHYIINYKDNSIIITTIFIISFYFYRMYDSLWTYASIKEFVFLVLACATGSISVIIYDLIIGNPLPDGVIALAFIFITLFIMISRLSFRVYRRIKKALLNNDDRPAVRTMIVGAGSGGSMVLEEIRNAKEINMKPICFIDDNSYKIGRTVSGVKVLGNRYAIPSMVKEKNIETIIISIPTISREDKLELVNICKNTGCKLKIVPGIFEIINGEIKLDEIRDINLEDLLGREPVELEDKGIKEYISGRVVIITGGGGSIGSELTRQILKFEPGKVIIFDNYENNAYDLKNELICKYPEVKLEIIIGSIRDKNRLDNIFNEYRPEVIFHAAAHKHVPLMEQCPGEAVLNNVFGTYNLAEVADKYNVKKFVMISTDKAVNPSSVMGATKRICEMIIQSFNVKSKTEFVAVRFGNVLGSNGSVVPLFYRQIAAGGPVTVTDKNITRYFMTIPEAAQLVLQAGAFAKGGEIFILDMGQPIKIYELAKDLIRLSGLELGVDINIEITGLRPGEKLYEEVLMDEEGINTTAHNKIYVAKPNIYDLNQLKVQCKELCVLCELGDDEAIVNKLKEIVPTYLKGEKNPKEDKKLCCS